MEQKSKKLYEGADNFIFVLKYDGQRTKHRRTFVCRYSDEDIFRRDSDEIEPYWKESISEKTEYLDILRKYKEIEKGVRQEHGEKSVFVVTKYKDYIVLYLNGGSEAFSKKVSVKDFFENSNIYLKIENGV